jgi:hypothetical protein
MYRYSVDNAIIYTPDDLVLFRESPFAVWMERLTLENPDHGILPDCDVPEPPLSGRHSDIASTLRAEGRNVALIDSLLDEPGRRAATLAVMREGVDFIVNGQLAAGALSGSVNLLMRTSGYSELGDFLYIPCDTLPEKTLTSAFRLSFAADLLQNLQGQLPPQMLIIRDGAEVVPLQTEDYIFYYRAVQNRFLNAMQVFRKHRMPDPSESAHFGRWSACASEVLRQRALSEQTRVDEQVAEAAEVAQATEVAQESREEPVELPQLRVASGSTSAYDMEPVSQSDAPRATSNAADMTYTLAEQARQLKPGRYGKGAPPGHTPNLARFGRPRAVPKAEADAENDSDDLLHPNRRSSDAALQNLQFIGSNTADIERRAVVDHPARRAEDIRPAPAPNLRDTARQERLETVSVEQPVRPQLPEREPKTPVFMPPEQANAAATAPSERLKSDLAEISAPKNGKASVIDMDSAPGPTLAPVVQRAEAEFERLFRNDPMFKQTDVQDSDNLPAKSLDTSRAASLDERAGTLSPKAQNGNKRDTELSPFSSSLITSDDFED